MRAHPHRAAELAQYNHLIHTAAQSFVWDNVYMYDKDFRLHLANHPQRSWSLILQQAWSVRLREKIRFNGNNNNGSGSGSSSSGKPNEFCKRLNQTGRCSYGNECKYEHRCSYCFRFGHGVINCRKLRMDRENGYRKDRYDRYDKYDRYDRFDRQDRRKDKAGGNEVRHHGSDKKFGKK